MPVSLFVSYSHKDKQFLDELQAALSVLKNNGDVVIWTDQRIGAGEFWDEQIGANLESAQIILLLLSRDFFASDYCNDEMSRAIERHKTNDVTAIPVIIRDCDWKETPLSKLQALPSGGTPISRWHDEDEAYQNVVEGIRDVLHLLVKSDQAGAPLVAYTPTEQETVDTTKSRVVEWPLCAINDLERLFARADQVDAARRVIATILRESPDNCVTVRLFGKQLHATVAQNRSRGQIDAQPNWIILQVNQNPE